MIGVLLALFAAERGMYMTGPEERKIYPGGAFDPMGLSKGANAESFKLKELKNGRLAMIAFMGEWGVRSCWACRASCCVRENWGRGRLGWSTTVGWVGPVTCWYLSISQPIYADMCLPPYLPPLQASLASTPPPARAPSRPWLSTSRTPGPPTSPPTACPSPSSKCLIAVPSVVCKVPWVWGSFMRWSWPAPCHPGWNTA